MAKQSPQIYIYKINSSRLRKAKWNLNVGIGEAINHKEIVTLSESTTIRFIQRINGIDSKLIHEKSKEIDKKIRQIKKLPTNTDNRKAIKQLYKEKFELLMVKDYVCIIIDSEKDFDRLNGKKGFFINGVKYKHLLGTTGGIKNYVVVYVNEKVYDDVYSKIENGRNINKPIVPAKLGAYQALTCSASIPVSDPKGILVVKDCETQFNANVIKIDDTVSDYPVITHETDYPITLTESDGYGLLHPDLAKLWSEELEEDYLPSGFCVRNSFCKGMVFTFDFIDFAEKIVNKYIVKDIWGHERDIRNVQIVLTASMLKLWDSYTSLEDYLNNCKENGYSFCVAKYTPESLENERETNYQFLQSLYLDSKSINELIRPTVLELHDILGYDYRKSILFSKGIHLNNMNFNKEECDYTKALMVDNRMINDPFVRTKIHNAIKKRITEAKIGVLKVKANYSIVSGDPFSLAQSIFGLEVTGLLKAGEFYSRYWNDLQVEKVACFRAPMTCHNNVKLLNIKDSNDMQYWYKYMNTVTIFNSWDTTSHALNGLDKDADAVFTTNCSTILNSIKETNAIFCVQKAATKICPTKEDLIKTNRDGFGDDIGVITNHITSMFEVLAKYDSDSKEYKTVMDRIMCGQNYQQNAIDKIKGIVSKSMPKEWYDYRSACTDEFNKSIVADKKPYFFIYIYPHRMREYKTYIDKANKNCRFTFGLTIDELITIEQKTPEQEKYLKYYYGRMPVSISNSVMNRICWRIEEEFDNIKTKFNEIEFDYSILKTDTQYSKGRYTALKKLYFEYVKKIQQGSQLSNTKRVDKETKNIFKAILKEDFKSKAYELCNDSEELCNILVDICYKNNDSKQFVWDMCGDIIIENLLKKNNYTVSYPVRDDLGDIEFGGERFSMIKQEVKREDCFK